MAEQEEYTIAEAALALGLAASTVRQLVANGALASRKVGARLNLIPARALDEYRAAHLGRQGWDKRRTPRE